VVASRYGSEFVLELEDLGSYFPQEAFQVALALVWEFRVGGYQVCEKWLKDRKGRQLSYDDQNHYQRVVVALKDQAFGKILSKRRRLFSGWRILIE